jgi:hypothetical protein
MSFFFDKTLKKMSLALGILGLGGVFSAHGQENSPAPVILTSDAPELRLDPEQSPAPAAAESPASSASFQELLAQERARAKAFFDEKIIEPIFSARLPFSLPDSLENLTQSLKELPLQSIAADEEFLKKAVIRFDAEKQIWSATWLKPKMFHFGMILRPSLLERVDVGKQLSFHTRGIQASLSKGQDGELTVTHDGISSNLDATELKNLLEQKISAEGLSLFLDRKGNLVLQAVGPAAVKLSKRQS